MAIIIEKMETKVYNITFKGYRLESDADTLPEYSGIYIAYRCLYNEKNDKVTLKELLYIGQAENLKTRILSHQYNGDLRNHCKNNEIVCYSYASVSLSDLNIVENALIFAQKPKYNEQLKDTFNYPTSEFNVEGSCGLLTYTNYKIS